MTQQSPLKVSTPSDREIVLTRVFEAPRQIVFDAFTKPEHIVRWFGRRGDEMIVCEVDLRVGGAWRFVWRLREGGEMGMYGEYREIVPPERLVNTENFEGPNFEEMGGPNFDAMGGEALTTLVLEETDGVTLATMTSLYQSREARDGVIATGMESGAAEAFDRLAELLPSLA